MINPSSETVSRRITTLQNNPCIDYNCKDDLLMSVGETGQGTLLHIKLSSSFYQSRSKEAIRITYFSKQK
jgi:hypothetical protein